MEGMWASDWQRVKREAYELSIGYGAYLASQRKRVKGRLSMFERLPLTSSVSKALWLNPLTLRHSRYCSLGLDWARKTCCTSLLGLTLA